MAEIVRIDTGVKDRLRKLTVVFGEVPREQFATDPLDHGNAMTPKLVTGLEFCGTLGLVETMYHFVQRGPTAQPRHISLQSCTCLQS